MIADSSAIDSADFALDGKRYVVACCPEHMKSLIENARVAWVVEELWFGRLCRASRLPGVRDADVGRIGVHARLSPADLRAALTWNSAQNEPRLTLPGGQVVPLVPPSDDR
ncbi:hypothetical protein H4696_001153 [Amycolatopsis lexingtonensis]|uniref:Uncharacterized protein n=1 Tax=Amycolatopsis lexingtonensis TaxID=218822 RepID=A0ABR9HT00_9PSEU|nr:hypothetical protein [Amycolatopsis lexingtonensis]MBE1494053.1 hypothetical protein [Amycolatopsis lexingtonensis]